MSWFSRLVFGVDLDAEAARGAELDGVIATQNQSALDRGVWTQEQYDAAEANRMSPDSVTSNAQAQVKDAFTEGAKEGLDEIRGGVQSVVTTATSFVPWWVWAVGLTLLFVRVGGLRYLFR